MLIFELTLTACLAGILVLGCWIGGLRSSGATRSDWPNILLIVLTVALGRSFLIAEFASPVPWWDQWGAEWRTLLRPILLGEYSLTSLLDAHNEHRIIFTRLQAWAIFAASGNWNPILEMLFNSVLVGMCTASLIYLISKPHSDRAFIAVTATILSMAPMHFANVMSGFQSQFAYLSIFTSSALALSLRPGASAICIAGACIAMSAALLTGAGGAFTGLACSLTLIFRRLCLRTPLTQHQTFVILFGITAFALGVWSTPHIVGHDPLQAADLLSFLKSVLWNLSWLTGGQFVWISLSSAVLIWGPLAVLALHALRHGKLKRFDEALPILALALWVLMQSLAIAYSRGQHGVPPASRYLDTLSWSLPCTLAALNLFVRNHESTFRRALTPAIIAFVAVIFVARIPFDIEQAERRSSFQRAHSETIKNFVSGYQTSLRDLRPMVELPHPSAALLEDFLREDILRNALHSELVASRHRVDVGEGIGFQSPGIFPYRNAVKPRLGSYGSYTLPGGNSNTGYWLTQSFEFSTDGVVLPIVGYPLAEGIFLTAIFSDGRREPIAIEKNPREEWTDFVFNVEGKPFSLLLEDKSMTDWVAVGPPRPSRRLETTLDALLYRPWHLLGLALGLLVILAASLRFRDRKRDAISCEFT